MGLTPREPILARLARMRHDITEAEEMGRGDWADAGEDRFEELEELMGLHRHPVASSLLAVLPPAPRVRLVLPQVITDIFRGPRVELELTNRFGVTIGDVVLAITSACVERRTVALIATASRRDPYAPDTSMRGSSLAVAALLTPT